MREREHTHASREGTERERGRERIPSRLYTVSTEQDAGLDLTNHEIMTKLKSRVGCLPD